MTISVVQTAPVNGFGSSVTFSAGITLGNWLLIHVPCYSGASTPPLPAGVPTIGGITPSVYTLLISQQSPATTDCTGFGLYLISVNAAIAGQTVVAVTVSNGSSAGPVAVETTGWTGTPTVDQSTSQGGTSTAVSSGTTGAITHAPEMIAGVNIIYGEGQSGGPAGYTNTDGSASGYAFFGYQIASSSGGTYTYADTAVGSANWAAGIVTLYSAGGAPAVNIPPFLAPMRLT